MPLTQQQQMQIIRRAASRAGIKPSVLWGLYGVETSYGRNVRPSTAGALGPFQIMPGTAKSLGINPLNFRQAANGAARYLAQYKSRGVRGMLAAYNAGPAADPSVAGSYPTDVLRASRSWQGGGRIAGLGGGGSSTTVDLGSSDPGSVPQGSQGILSLIQQLTAKPVQPQSAGLQTPSFAAAPALPQAYQPPMGGGGPAPKPDTSALLAAIQTVGGDVPGAGGSGGVSVTSGGQMPAGAAGGAVAAGRVTVAPGANRAGVPLRSNVVSFVQRVSALDGGRPLTIGTGSNHPERTVNGSISDHWRGEAADVPLTGRALIKAGQAALIAAGMSPAQARKQTGGGFNVGRWQVIFNTDAPGWGDHTTHLHVGRRR